MSKIVLLGDKTSRWKGELVGYSALHKWVAKYKGRNHICEWCKNEGYTEMANLDFEYTRDLLTWAELCKCCHEKHDRKKGWGDGKKRYEQLLQKRLAIVLS